MQCAAPPAAAAHQQTKRAAVEAAIAAAAILVWPLWLCWLHDFLLAGKSGPEKGKRGAADVAKRQPVAGMPCC